MYQDKLKRIYSTPIIKEFKHNQLKKLKTWQLKNNITHYIIPYPKILNHYLKIVLNHFQNRIEIIT